MALHTHAALPAAVEPAPIQWEKAVVVVGAGPTGFRFIEEFRHKDQTTPVVLFGNEPYRPYDRVRLSSMLAGNDTPEALELPLAKLEEMANFRYIFAEIEEIGPESHRVIDIYGQSYPYDKLILATGSRPHIPDIKGIELDGVFTFRNMRDSERLKARTTRSKRLVVVGGGLLGIEAARAMLQGHTEITLVQQANRLMNQQLDEAAAARLQNQLESLGIRVITGAGVGHIDGDDHVEAVVLRDGTRLECDSVLISAGIRPNMELARRAWIKVNRGIRVDDQLRTSDPNIYAIGECAEHRERVYGLVAPGLEQAAVAADAICGGESQYLGSNSVAKLKVVGTPVFSMGEVDMELERKKAIVYAEKGKRKTDTYRKLVLNRGHIVGAMSIGEWSEIPRIQELITHNRRLLPWQRLRFRLTGHLWNPADAQNPHQWPEETIICNCNNVARGTLSAAVAGGCCSTAELTAATLAGSTCGSCKPLLQLMVGSEGEKLQPEYGWRGLIITGLLTCLIALALLLTPGFSTSESVQGGFKFEQIWNDELNKQITGFSLLGLTVIGLLMSLRKRFSKFKRGSFANWRLLHVVLGVAALAVLLAHTGFHTGSNLNQWLLFNFLGLAVVGSLAGFVIAVQYKMTPSIGRKFRDFWFWSHLMLAWPLPALLGFHILSVYYF